MNGENYMELVDILSKQYKMEVLEDKEIMIKDIPDSNQKGVLDPRVYKERLKPKKKYVDATNYTFHGIAIGEMRLGMGWPNIDISTGIKTEIKEIDLGDRKIGIRIYSPKECKKDRKCLIFIHGGGFYGGNVDVVENPCKAIAEKSQSVVISINYRLAPEYPYPYGLNDCFDVLKYVYSNAHEFNINKYKIGISGDSAGGNIAAVCSIRDRELGTDMIKYVALLYPVVTLSNKEDMYYKWNIEKYEISREKELIEGIATGLKNVMGVINKLYLQGNVSDEHYEVSPLLYNLDNLPRTLVVTAEYDFLRVQGEAYFSKLVDSGVEARGIRYRGMDHAFLDKCGYYPQAEDCINEIVKDMEYM